MSNDVLDAAVSHAIAHARQRGAEEISADDLLRGGLRALSTFGVVEIGAILIDLDALGIDWLSVPDRHGAKVRYSQEAVALFDRAARIAQGAVKLPHLMAAIDWSRNEGTVAELARLGLNAAAWRHALARLATAPAPATIDPKPRPVDRDWLSPEEAAQHLGVHVQTIRGYIKSGKLPASRLAGERAIRIRATDLARVLEPLNEPTNKET